MRVYGQLLPGRTQYWWSYFGLAMAGVAVMCVLLGCVFILAHVVVGVVAFFLMALASMWGIAIGFVMAKRMQRRELKSGYFTAPATRNDISDMVVQVDPATGVVVKEAGSEPIATDKWSTARKEARVWAREQALLGTFPELPRGWPDPRKVAARQRR